MAKEAWTKKARLVGIDYVFNFGKYAGFSYQEILWAKIDYIKFLLKRRIIALTEEAKNEMYHAQFNDNLKKVKSFTSMPEDIDLELILNNSIDSVDSYIK